jgi:hypothetical protein
MKLTQRLDQLEAKQAPVKPTRFFTYYSDTGRYYEAGSAPVNYRRGLGDADDGPFLTRADIDAIERQGYPCTVITIQYVENWRGDAL